MATRPDAEPQGLDEHAAGDEVGDEAEVPAAAEHPGKPDVEEGDEDTEKGASGAGGAGAAAPVALTGWQRMTQTFVNPPKPKAVEAVDFSSMTDDEIRARINRIDGTERKVGLAAAWLTVLLTLLSTLPDLLASKPVYGDVAPVKGKCPAHATYFPAKHGSVAYCQELVSRDVVIISLVVGLVFAVGIYLCVRWQRRSAVAFAIGFTGVALSSINTVAALPFIIAAIWLVVRAYRTQKNGAPNARSPLAGYRRPPPRSRPRRQLGHGSVVGDRVEDAAEVGGQGRARWGTGQGGAERPPRAPARTSATPPRHRPRRSPRPPDGCPRPGAPRRRAGRSVGHQGRAQQGQDVGPAPDQRAGGGLLADGPQHLHLGHHADDRRVDGQQQQVGVVPPHVPGLHLGLEEGRGPLDQGSRGPPSSGWPPAGPGGRPRAPAPAARAGGRPGGTPSGPPPRPAPSWPPAPSRAACMAAASSPALRAMSASSSASLDGNQYRMVCLVISSVPARASREVAS